jgi:hypothetical protein
MTIMNLKMCGGDRGTASMTSLGNTAKEKHSRIHKSHQPPTMGDSNALLTYFSSFEILPPPKHTITIGGHFQGSHAVD